MYSSMSQSTHPSEEAMRNTRLALGLRALAATVIVGGIVIAALDNGVPSNRAMPGGAPIGQVDLYGTAAPLVTPATEAPASRATGAEDPALGRIDKAMEQQG